MGQQQAKDNAAGDDAFRDITVTADPLQLMRATVPHGVIPQLLRPVVAHHLPPSAVGLFSARDASLCVATLTVPPNTKTVVSHLWSMGSLTDLDVTSCADQLRSSWAKVSRLKHLTSLNLTWWTLREETLRSLGPLKHLTSLTCTHDDGFELGPLLAKYIPQLEDLRLRHCSVEVDKVLDPRAPLLHLRRFDTSRCRGVRALEPLSSFASLEEVVLTGRPESIGRLCALPALTALDLTGLLNHSDSDFRSIGQMKQLTSLSLLSFGCACSPATVAENLVCLRLRKLRILGGYRPVDHESFRQIMRALAPTLTSLDLGRAQLRPDTVQELAVLANLVELTLKETPRIVSAIEEATEGLPCLRMLWTSGVTGTT